MEQRAGDNPVPTGDHLAQWQVDIPKWVAYDLALIKSDDGTLGNASNGGSNLSNFA